METTQMSDDCDEPDSSREIDEQAGHYDVPLCPNRLILAVEAVRGPGIALALLREHLQLRETATMVFSAYSDCFFLRLDEIDRFQNRCVGGLEAVTTMPFKAGGIFKREVSTWTDSDVAGVEDATGVGALTALGLMSPAP
ncbi:hypothetical protein I5F53_10915 [Pseudomonas aeruginosa]|nr:hypothetical protein [Pseudomonas aeruginosa]ELK3488799.1 hypothetical protein [Pseudomonas aeruginosa]EME9750180.1 hypothetical protein [Pseudomonas aeruginosa]MBG4583270.1 hypothetical protein [Pseudomonas aeruginosa]MBH9070836.1 hypothetical protein [Pseudomonas aeruginosa]